MNQGFSYNKYILKCIFQIFVVRSFSPEIKKKTPSGFRYFLERSESINHELTKYQMIDKQRELLIIKSGKLEYLDEKQYLILFISPRESK